jgi:tryptophanyl-tRNA synthetase
MSKSATGANHAVALLDPPDKIRKTIMRATTDSNPAVDFETAGPGVLNLLSIYQAFSGEPTTPSSPLHRHALRRLEEAGGRNGDLAPGALPAALPRDRLRPGYLDRVLREGAERVAPIANAPSAP